MRTAAKQKPLPPDIAAMDEKQVRAAINRHDTDREAGKFDALVEVRDKAQAEIQAWVQHGNDLTRRLTELLEEREGA